MKGICPDTKKRDPTIKESCLGRIGGHKRLGYGDSSSLF